MYLRIPICTLKEVKFPYTGNIATVLVRIQISFHTNVQETGMYVAMQYISVQKISVFKPGARLVS